MADVDRGAHFEAGHVDHDVIGDGIGDADQFEFVTHDVEHATLLEARRGFFVLEHDGHVHVHFGVRSQTQEVGVLGAVVDGVEGHVLGQGADGFAADRQFDDRVEEVAGAQRAGQSLFFKMDGNRFLVAAIDHGGGAAVAAQGTGGSLASPFAQFGRQGQRLAHVEYLPVGNSVDAPLPRLQG